MKSTGRGAMSCGVIVALLVLSAALFPQIASENPDPSREFVDDYGRRVYIPDTPERIISLFPSTTEILFALGLGDKVVGVSDYCDYPPEVEEKDRVCGYSTPNVEEIILLEPDIIFIGGIVGREPVDLLEGIGLRVFALKEADSIGMIFSHIGIIGEITGAGEEARALVAGMASEIEEVRKSVMEKDRIKVAIIIWYQRDPTSLWVVGGNTYQNEMIEIAGGDNVFSDVDGYKSYQTCEKLIINNPDVIIVYQGHGSAIDTVRIITADSTLRGMKAIKTRSVFGVNEDLLARDGPRIVDGIRSLYDCIAESRQVLT